MNKREEEEKMEEERRTRYLDDFTAFARYVTARTRRPRQDEHTH